MPTELKSAPAVNPLKTKYLFSAGAPYGTSEGTERFPAKTLEFTNAAAGETFHSSCAARERNRRAATVPRPPYRVADTAAQRWDRAASEVPYDEATLRQSYARTRDIYAANVEKSRATRDPITFQLHDASGALKKGGVAVEESGWDRPAPGARDGNDRAFPLPERARKLILARLPKFLDDEA